MQCDGRDTWKHASPLCVIRRPARRYIFIPRSNKYNLAYFISNRRRCSGSCVRLLSVFLRQFIGLESVSVSSPANAWLCVDAHSEAFEGALHIHFFFSLSRSLSTGLVSSYARSLRLQPRRLGDINPKHNTHGFH